MRLPIKIYFYPIAKKPISCLMQQRQLVWNGLGPHQHLQIARFRAAEHQKYLVNRHQLVSAP